MTRKSKTRKIGSLGPSLKPKAVAREERSKQQKRSKQHKGNTPGNRQQVATKSSGRQSINQPNIDGELVKKIGSKKPIALGVAKSEVVKSAVAEKATSKGKDKDKQTHKSADAQFAAWAAALSELEQRDDFNLLLDKVDAGESLSAEEQALFDHYVAEHQRLTEALGLDNEDAAESSATSSERKPHSEEELWDSFNQGEALLKQFEKGDE
jgi:ribosome assembly protein YihI (activator of Der GTPase)